MPCRLWIAAACAALIVSPLAAQFEPPFGNVKAWTGTITLDVAETRRTAFNQPQTVSYHASGPVTIADEMMPDGAHQQWPIPSAAEQTTRLEEAFKRWAAHIVYKEETKGVDELGQPLLISCAADETRNGRVELVAGMMMPAYQLQIEVPRVTGACKGTDQSVRKSEFNLGPNPVVVLIPKKAPPFTGTETKTVGSTAVRVTYTIGPKP